MPRRGDAGHRYRRGDGVSGKRERRAAVMQDIVIDVVTA
jgi:hypothetical protein